MVSGLVIAAATICSEFVCTTMGPPIRVYRAKLSRFNRSPVRGHSSSPSRSSDADP
jgi:hypothetical protein